jgi:hypothetical protein
MSPELSEIAYRLWREYEMGDALWKRPPWAEMSPEEKARIVDVSITTSDHLYRLWSVLHIRALRSLGAPVGIPLDELTERAANLVLEDILAAVDAAERSLVDGRFTDEV